MERLIMTPRNNYQETVEALGLSFHTDNGEIYWDERVCYRLTEKEVEAIKLATNEIDKMCLELVDHVVRCERYYELNIPEHAWGLIESSWLCRDKSLFGRFDLSYDGVQPPKLLEYNADCVGSLLEASVIQLNWLEQVLPNNRQFNSIHKRLVAAWSQFGPGPIHLTCVESLRDDFVDTTYMASVVRQAGLVAKQVSIETIDWNGQAYVDAEKSAIKSLFKLYPWECLINEWSCDNLNEASVQLIEPPWKMILSNKNMMVLLWEMFPNHPNLLPSFFIPKFIRGDYIQKPIYGIRGNNVSIYSKKNNILAEGEYDFCDGPLMYQQIHQLLKIDGNYSIIGSWVVAGESAGIGIREDIIPIMNDDSRFVPHFFE